MSDDLIERLKHRADTMNGASPVGAGDGNTYACGYYGMIDRKLDRVLLDALAAKDTALSEMRAELERARKALKPFAKIADCEPSTPDGASTIVNISRCRDAARALHPAQDDCGGGR